MGIFSKKEICFVCNSEIGKNKVLDGYICNECYKKCIRFLPKDRVLKLQAKNDIIQALEFSNYNYSMYSDFNATQKVGEYLHIDENKRLWFIPNKKLTPIVYKYEDILDFELLEDGETIVKGSGIGRAIAGGILFGGVGAVVGGVTGGKKTKSIVNSLKIKITINSVITPDLYIDILTSQVKSNSLLYKACYENAQKILSTLNVISQEKIKENEVELSNTSISDEIRKLNNLMKDGIITEREFETQKEKLLNM